MLRVCKYCNQQFEAHGKGVSGCCPACAKKQRETSLRLRTCVTCGSSFVGGPSARYCPRCRVERQREANRRQKRNGAARPLGSTDLCAVCGKPYIVTGGLQKYCVDCAPDAIRALDRAKSREWNTTHTSPAQRREIRERSIVPRTCAVCGKPFVPRSTALTCSAACSAELTRQRRSAWEKEHTGERRAYRREKYRQHKEQMTPDEYRAYRDQVNARARENYHKRKNKE